MNCYHTANCDISINVSGILCLSTGTFHMSFNIKIKNFWCDLTRSERHKPSSIEPQSLDFNQLRSSTVAGAFHYHVARPKAPECPIELLKHKEADLFSSFLARRNVQKWQKFIRHQFSGTCTYWATSTFTKAHKNIKTTKACGKIFTTEMLKKKKMV